MNIAWGAIMVISCVQPSVVRNMDDIYKNSMGRWYSNIKYSRNAEFVTSLYTVNDKSFPFLWISKNRISFPNSLQKFYNWDDPSCIWKYALLVKSLSFLWKVETSYFNMKIMVWRSKPKHPSKARVLLKVWGLWTL